MNDHRKSIGTKRVANNSLPPRSLLTAVVVAAWTSVCPAQQIPGDPPDDAGIVPEGVDYDADRPKDYYERARDRRDRDRQQRQYRRDSRFARTDPARNGWWGQRGYGRGYVVVPGGWTAPYGVRYIDPGFHNGYDEGFDDGRRFQDWQVRTERGSRNYLAAMESGNTAFHEARYDDAVRWYLLAARLNQGDAASRLHLVHARVAVGQYAEAAPALRRAIELQPKLVYLPLDIRSEYGDATDLDKHFDALLAAQPADGSDRNLAMLIGYYQLFTNRQAQAAQTLLAAVQQDPDDRVIAALYDSAGPSLPERNDSVEE